MNARWIVVAMVLGLGFGCGNYGDEVAAPGGIGGGDTTTVGGTKTSGGVDLFANTPVASNEWDVAIRNIPVSGTETRVLRIYWTGKQNPKVEIGHAKLAEARNGAGQDHTSLVAPYMELTLTQGDNFVSITPWTGNTDVDGDGKVDDNWWLDAGLDRLKATDRAKAAQMLRGFIKAELQ